MYKSMSELFFSNIKKPELIDKITFRKDGIIFHVYGVLHGLTGATNKEYKAFVNHTIANATGMKLCEKSMKMMYNGLDYELDDWLQVPAKDVFLLTIKLFLSPITIYDLLKTLVKETLQKKDKFNKNNIRRIQDLGGSLYFHLLKPEERRVLVGFPTSEQYFRENMLRRKGKGTLHSFNRTDPDWRWLSHIEKNVNIPYRSVHMFERALQLAKEKNIQEVSMFVGESHNSDINWYVNNDIKDKEMLEEIKKIKKKTQLSKTGMLTAKCVYLGSSALAASISMIIYVGLYIFLKN